MALLSPTLFLTSTSDPDSTIAPRNSRFSPHSPQKLASPSFAISTPAWKKHSKLPSLASHLCTHQTPVILDKPALSIAEASSESELWAAARLRIRSFFEFVDQTYGVEDHKRYLAECEFEALKDRIAGKRIGFRRVSCINATLPLSQALRSSDDLCSGCKNGQSPSAVCHDGKKGLWKVAFLVDGVDLANASCRDYANSTLLLLLFSDNGENRVVVGSLDLNQCLRLADEITGKRPEGIGADFARAYLSNVCVAKELHRNGIGYALVAKSKKIAQDWGITDLYAHVAIDNEPAKQLYTKSGFVYENEEPAWQARFLGRPRRLLLWADLTKAINL